MSRHRNDPMLLSLREATPLAEAEIERARRYDRHVSLIILKGGEISRFTARIPDLVIDLDRSRVMVVAPETDAENARNFGQRICQITGAQMDGSASFPEDGQSFASLMRVATQRRRTVALDEVTR